jgi:Cu/Ag efflux pump CusA
MTRVTSELVKELRQLPGVENVGAHVGRAVASDKVVGVNSAQVWVSVAPDADYEDTLEAVEAVVDSYPGMDTELTTYSEQNIMAARAGESDVLTLRLYGQDSDVLSIEAQKLQAALEEIDGVAEIDVKRAQTKPTVEIRVDLARARQYGIKPGDVRRAGATLLSGLQVGSLFEDKKVFDVIVWSTPETRSSLTDIENLLIQAPDGRHVRLKEIAEIAIKSSPTSIKREGVARYLDAEIDIEGRGIDAVAADIEALLETYAFPMEYHAEVMDNFRVQQDWRGQLLAVALATLIGVLLVLQSALRSWRLAAILVVSLPVAVLGGLVATLLLGTDHLIGEFLGLLLVVALAVRLGLALYLQFQSLERNQGMAFGAPLVTRGVADRTVPTLATLSVTTAAVLPFALMTAADGMEVLGPMAIVVIGGLISTLALVLFVLPVLYLRYGADSAAEEDFEDLLGATPHAG